MTANVLDALRALPTETNSWADIRSKDLLYVDKTELILDLVSNHKRAFIARPQGFGKTLLNSILTELFRHGDQSFEGTTIYGKWNRPLGTKVISCNFSGPAQTTASGLTALICKRLVEACRQAGFTEDVCKQLSLPITFEGFFRQLKAVTREESLMFLIDDWDYHLLVSLTVGWQFKGLAKVLRQFFTEFETLDNVEFALVTGTLRYSGGCPWAGDERYDQTLSSHYATLLGYTESELERYFTAYAQATLQRKDELTEDFCTLREYYGGYCFDEQAETKLYSSHEINAFYAQLWESDEELNFKFFWCTNPSPNHDLVALIAKHKPTDSTIQRYWDGDTWFSRAQLAACSTYDQLSFDQLMLQLGYLRVIAREDDSKSRGPRYVCGLANGEIGDIIEYALDLYDEGYRHYIQCD